MGELKKRILKEVFCPNCGEYMNEDELAKIVDEAKKEFPKLEDRSHEYVTVDTMTPEEVFSGFIDAFGYIRDVFDWKKKWLDDSAVKEH